MYQEVIQTISPDLAAISFAASSGLIIRLSLSVGQRWSSGCIIIQCPICLTRCYFVIVKIISGNIALSLGMIGALSIVRFRNPVKPV